MLYKAFVNKTLKLPSKLFGSLNNGTADPQNEEKIVLHGHKVLYGDSNNTV